MKRLRSPLSEWHPEIQSCQEQKPIHTQIDSLQVPPSPEKLKNENR